MNSPEFPTPDLEWFNDAKFGVFVHWGIYAVGQYPESWSFYNHGAEGHDPNDTLPHADYMAQRHAFFARRYDPAAWADLFADAGARYSVLTTKHHDGMALWDTAEHLSVVRDTPGGRDLVGPFCGAMRARGLHVGLYFSHNDWNHPDYATLHGPPGTPDGYPGHRFSFASGPEEPDRWANFVRFHRLQLRELCERYSPDLLWFDGDWERNWQQWDFEQLNRQLRTWRPGVVINSRIGPHGDYATPEQAIPTMPPGRPWELCLTLNRSWSMATDPSYKPVGELIRTLAECAGMGGNLLLNVAPLSDGTIFYEQARLLREIGAWLKINGEGIYGTRAGIPPSHWAGASTRSADGRTVYLIQFGQPNGEVPLKGLRNKVLSATVLGGDGSQIACRISGGAPWMNIPGVLWLDIPAAACRPHATIIKLELDGPLDLHTSEGQAVTQN